MTTSKDIREKASRYRVLAGQIPDEQARTALREAACRCEQEARAIDEAERTGMRAGARASVSGSGGGGAQG